MMANPVAARRQLRLAALQALSVLVASNVIRKLASPGVLPSQSETMPSVLVRVLRTGKEAMSASTSNFNSTVLLEIESRLTAGTQEEVQDALEQLDAEVERALFTNAAFVAMSQKISVETDTQITSESRDFVGWTTMHLRCELVEVFDPIYDAPPQWQPVAVPLEQFGIHNDMIGTFDPSGTYAQPDFPSAALPAPRTSGPDGRDEGALEIDLPQ